jgi:hypothetical protein
MKSLWRLWWHIKDFLAEFCFAVRDFFGCVAVVVAFVSLLGLFR